MFIENANDLFRALQVKRDAYQRLGVQTVITLVNAKFIKPNSEFGRGRIQTLAKKILLIRIGWNFESRSA